MTDRQAEGKRKLILAIALLEKERIDKENHKRKRKTAMVRCDIHAFRISIGYDHNDTRRCKRVLHDDRRIVGFVNISVEKCSCYFFDTIHVCLIYLAHCFFRIPRFSVILG